MSDSRRALHLPFRSDVWILSQTVVCFSLWFDRFCASVPAACGRECRSKSGHACQNGFCVGSDGVWHGIAFACALTAKDRDLHSVQFVGQFQHARRVRFLGREASGYDRRSSPHKSRPKLSPKIGGCQIDDTDAVSIGYRKSYGRFGTFAQRFPIYFFIFYYHEVILIL